MEYVISDRRVKVRSGITGYLLFDAAIKTCKGCERRFVTKQEAETAILSAAAEAEQVVDGLRVAYATSGGKDSIALIPIMEAAGVRRAVWGMMPPFEFPEFMRWCEENLPAYTDAEPQNSYDLAWLAQNRDKLFPADASSGYWWSMAGTRWSQTTYYKKNDLQALHR